MKFLAPVISRFSPVSVSIALILGISTLTVACLTQKADKSGTEFRIALIPDTQFYTAQTKGATIEMFRAQIRWIKQHVKDSSIAYVAGVGDIVDDNGKGDPMEKQWTNAVYDGGYYDLEVPAPGIPYGLAVGNHDEADFAIPREQPGKYHNQPGLNPTRNTTQFYNKYFGVDHFKDKPWYGGHANIQGKNNNDCHFDRFTVAGQQYIVIFLPFDNGKFEDRDGLMTRWADSVLSANATAKAFIVSHSMLQLNKDDDRQNVFSPQGRRIYEAVKDHKNVIAMMCGHVTGEGYRKDTYNGHAIRTYMTDYQSEINGGNGKMRTMRINTLTDSISLRTFSPFTHPMN